MSMNFSLFGKSQESSKEPDFAYPKEVIANSEKAMNTALKSKDSIALLKAFIQNSTAQSLISDDNLPKILAKCEQLIDTEKNITIKCLLYSYEANEIYDYYEENRYIYNRRNLSTDTLPKDITEWSKEQIINKINDLLNKSLEYSEFTSKENVAKYKSILTYNKYGELVAPTIFDLLANNALESEVFIGKEQLLSKVISMANTSVESTIYWKLKSIKDNYTDLFNFYNQYSDNEYSGLILNKLYKTASGLNHLHDKEMFKLLDEFMKKFPSYPFINDIINSYNDLCAKYIAITSDGVFSSTDSINSVANINNITKFKVDLYRFPDNYDVRRNNVFPKLSECKLVDSKTIECNDTVPFYDKKIDIKFGPQKYGRYTIVSSFEKDKGKVHSTINSSFVVSDIQIFSITDNITIGSTVFAVDGKTGKPLDGVDIYGIVNSSPILIATTKDGSAKINYKTNLQIKAKKIDDCYGNYQYLYSTSYLPDKSWTTNMSAYTDLGVYRPGEDVNFVAITYKSNGTFRHLFSGEKIKVYLEDNNGELVSDTLELISDNYGRISGKFTIPTGRMNGTFRLRFKNVNNAGYVNKAIEVSEYKMPTFDIKFTNLPNQFYSRDKSITIEGSANTYSGVPMANMNIKLGLNQINWSPWWRWIGFINGSTHISNFVVTTDSKGNFKLTIPIDSLNYNPKKFDEEDFNIFDFQIYQLKADLTSPSGETQSATGTFIIDGFSQLTFDGNLNLNVSEPIMLPVKIQSTNEADDKECDYELYNNKNELVKKGSFYPLKTKIDLSDIKSGEYELRVNISGDKKITTDNVILYRPTESSCPTNKAFWIPNDEIQADANGRCKIYLGSNTTSYAYYIITAGNKIVSKGWSTIKEGMTNYPVQIPKLTTNKYQITFYVNKKFNAQSYNVTILPYQKPEVLKMSIESFRDKVCSGDKEIWKFKFTDKSGSPLKVATILDIYDKAVDAIMPNSFNFIAPSLSKINLNFNRMSTRDFYLSLSNKLAYKDPKNWIAVPQIIAYIKHGSYNRGIIRMHKSAIPYADNSSVIFSEEASLTLDSGGALVSVRDEGLPTQPEFDNVQMRIGKLKVAMWKPMLTSDSEGNLIINFEVPNYNTTWILRSLSYTEDFLINNQTKEFVSQKPLMVQPNLPRFLRQGDKATISATLINATENTMDCKVQIELFNPSNNVVIDTKTEELTLAGNEQKTYSIEWQVPDTIPFIGYRIKAITNNFSDGEQDVIPVLTSISPVIESQPFYMNPAQTNLELPLMKIPTDAKVSIEFCNNPAWYCITALPSLFKEDALTSTELGHTLYSIILAQGISKMNPSIRKAIEYWNEHSEDSVLISMLEKNPSLKIGELRNSPWLTDAQRQTLQMQSISKLYDEAYISGIKAATIKSLSSLQNADGGWSWFRGIGSSYYSTFEILTLFGELKQLGYTNDETTILDMIKRGVDYIDRTIIDMYNKQTDKKDYRIFCDYAYLRSFFPDIRISNLLQNFINKALNITSSEWKSYSLPNKAYAAILLEKSGKKADAQNIVRSIKEFSISTPYKGTYWDNLQTFGYRYYNKITLSSLMLQAIHAVNPKDTIIDSVRQWILFQKQTNDWGSSSLAVDAIYTILSTGTQWLSTSSQPNIKIGNSAIKFSKFEEYTGYGIRNIRVPANNSILTINRVGTSPAWGAIFAQFAAPMKDINAKGTDDLSITKSILNIDGSKLSGKKQFNVGDKVKILLTIKSKENLEYVTLHDERCATMEPISQISDYIWDDGTGYYLEIKDSATNIFFGYLPKGTHLISYDVTITSAGEYNLGIATIQSQYSPQLTAHSAGTIMNVK